MTPLEFKLIAKMGNAGPITFRDFMDTALYDPEYGYYNTMSPKIGAKGDFYTSSNVHAAFGAVLAECFVRLWKQIGSTESTDRAPFNIVEIGAGTGQLAQDIITALRTEHPSEFSVLDYKIAETSPRMRQLQREKLTDFADRVRWIDLNATNPPQFEQPFPGIVFSNELIDAMPVHVVRRSGKSFEELYVTADGEPGDISHAKQDQTPPNETQTSRFRFEWGPISTLRIADYLNRFAPELQNGQIVEVNLQALDLLEAISIRLEEGFLVTIDYGDLGEHLYGPGRRNGTLRSFRKHALAPSVLERIGEQDITASVNFSALIEYGKTVGLELVSYERQSSFLIRNGLIDRIAAIASRSETGDTANMKDRLAVKNLFVPGGASDNFRVLIQQKANSATVTR